MLNKSIMPKGFLVFDVESVGLHGGHFSVGYVAAPIEQSDPNNLVFSDEGYFSVPSFHACGSAKDREWVKKNIIEPTPNCYSQEEIRTAFWNIWLKWKKQDYWLAADCPWPVEAGFLKACINDDCRHREIDGPYPLIDVASVLLAKGYDPLKSYIRLGQELPIHDPLADAKQSARLLMAALTGQEVR